MVFEKTTITNFFKELIAGKPEEFKILLQKHKIDYKSLIPFASWSNEKYNRICLDRNENYELVLLCWMPGQKTKVHDHNGQHCQVYFAKGEFEEYIYLAENPNNCLQTNQVLEGSITEIKQANQLHSLTNVSNELAMTLHLYANPIEKCKVYDSQNNSATEVPLTYDNEISHENQSELLADLNEFVKISKALVIDEKENPISTRILVDDLHEKIDIKLNDQGLADSDFYKLTQEVVLSTPKTSSKLFFNQLFGGRQSKAVLGDLLAVMLNNSMYTYKVAGVQVGIEKEILSQVIDRINYGDAANGTFPTGGSMSNFMGLLMARDAHDSKSRFEGLQENLVAYTSKESHYSIEKNAAFIGLGRVNVRKIASDANGRLCVDSLEKAIKEDISKGKKPFFVNATAGTTVLGAFDPIDQMGDIAKQYNLWLHIDGAYCGAVILSKKYGHLLAGIEKSDSFSFNPHKMLGTPMTCSILVVKDKQHLYDSFSNSAEYLYQTDQDDYNLGKTSFQCGRRNDALKLWTLWKSIGSNGLEKLIDKQFQLADFARNYVINHPDYKLYSFDDSVSVCFNYKGIKAEQLCTALYEENKLMVGYGTFNTDEFVRLVTINTNNNEEDILHFFKTIEAYA